MTKIPPLGAPLEAGPRGGQQVSPHTPLFTSALFPLPCDSFPTANIIPGPTAHAYDDPILVLRFEFRVERVRERERSDFPARHWIFTASIYALFVQGRRGLPSGYGECKGAGWRWSSPACHSFAVDNWGSLKAALGASVSFILYTPTLSAALGAA